MRVIAIVGSIRKESYNLKLAQYMKDRYQNKLDIEITNIRNLPLYNEDIEKETPEAVSQLIKRVKEADAVLWVTPEYNYSITGVLKNAIDWLSRGEKVMLGKPSWIVGASMSMMGSIRAQNHLRDILISPGISSPLLPGNEVYIGLVHEKFNETDLVHEPTIAYLDKVAANFITWLEQQVRKN